MNQEHLSSITFPASTGRAAPSAAAAAAASSLTQTAFSAMGRQRDGFWTVHSRSVVDGVSSWLPGGT